MENGSSESLPGPESTPLSAGGDRTVTLLPGVVVPANLLHWTFSRSGGPGGQNVNKLATRAQLRLSVAALQPYLGAAACRRLRTLAGRRLTEAGELVLTAADQRSQRANRQACLQRLSTLLERALHPPPPRRRTRPTRAAKERRLEAKRQRSQRKRTRRTPPSD